MFYEVFDAVLSTVDKMLSGKTNRRRMKTTNSNFAQWYTKAHKPESKIKKLITSMTAHKVAMKSSELCEYEAVKKTLTSIF